MFYTSNFYFAFRLLFLLSFSISKPLVYNKRIIIIINKKANFVKNI